MDRRSPSRTGSPRGRRATSAACGLALVLGLAASGPAVAATVLEKTVTLDLSRSDVVRERVKLTIRIDRREDLDDWSPYPVALDENRKLLRLAAATLEPGGRSRAVPEENLDWMEYAGDGVLHSSGRLRIVRFPAVPPGSLLSIEYEVEERPWFPSGAFRVGEDDPIETLRIEVKAPSAGFRWTLTGDRSGLAVDEHPGGLTLSASGLAGAPDLDLAPGGSDSGPVLRYAWGSVEGWDGVGAWFRELARQVPRADPATREKARQAAAGAVEPRARLEALLRFVQRDVRYVAVEVGVGGYRPSPPAQVLARRWGDCKDKAFLLIDLLAEMGIHAHPVLLRAGGDAPVDASFPSPGWFDHMIVAVPTAGLGLTDQDPVADGFLFVDPTQTVGAATWLHPGDQGRLALVVTDGGAQVVRTPVLPRLEARLLDLDVAVSPNGDAAGSVRLELRGARGAGVGARLTSTDPARNEAELRGLFEAWFPGAAVDAIRWVVTKEPVPALTVEAGLELPAFLQRTGDGASANLDGVLATAPPSTFEERAVPWVLTPGLTRVSWRLDLAGTGCRLEDRVADAAGAQGRFHFEATTDGTVASVVRETEITTRWVEPDDGPALRELALAEHRAVKRRLRFQCEPP